MTHNEIIKHHLENVGPLTRHYAAGEYWIHELSNRMSEIENEGYPISRKKITRRNPKTGRTVTFMEYRKA